MAKKESKKARKKRLASEGLVGQELKQESKSIGQEKKQKAKTQPFDIKKLWPVALLLVFTFICFYPSLDCGTVNWDDDKNFSENELITTLNDKNFWSNTVEIFKTPVIGNYNPLPIFTFAIEQRLFGSADYTIWHLDNILLHLICVLFVYLIGLELGLSIWATLFFAALFAVHPMRVESVTWLTERKDVLFGAFYLVALYYYIKSVRTKPSFKFTAIIWICFILSLLSKIQAVILPISMILVDYYFSGKISFKGILKKTPYFLASLAFGIIGIIMLKSQGSLETADNYSTIDRLFVGSWSLIVYFFKSLVPYQLSPLYPYPTTIPWYFYPSVLSFFGVAAYLWYAYKKNWRVGFFGVGFFFANIFFLLQILGAGQGFLADRFSYISYIGLFFIFAYYLDKLITNRAQFKAAGLGVAALLILGYGFMTFNQTKVWTDSETLWTHVLKYYQKVTLPYGNRANFRRDKSQVLTSQANFAKQQNNEAEYQRLLGESNRYVQLALADYTKTIGLKPDKAGPYNSRARLYFNFTNPDSLRKALFNYGKAIELDPEEDEYWINRGATYAKLGDYPNALKNLDKGISIDPSFSNGYLNRSVIYNINGDRVNALKDIEKYLSLKPYSPDLWYECAQLRHIMGKNQAALEAVNTAMSYNKNPNKQVLGKYHFGRATIHSSMGNSAAAKQDLSQAQNMGYKGDPATIQKIMSN